MAYQTTKSGTCYPSEEQESQNFVCYPNWKGIYSDIGTPASALQAPLNYHVVLTTEPDADGGVQTFVYKVPETWMDVNLAYFLYPSPGFNVNGVKPWNWGDISFKKRRFPETSYVEYDVVDLLTETGPGDEESEWEGQAESHPKAGSSKVAKRICGPAELGNKSVPDSPNSTPEEDYDHQLSPIKLSMKEASATEENGEAESRYQQKVLQALRSILDVLKSMRNEKASCETVMKDNMEHFKKVVKSQLSLPILVPEEVAVLNAALCDMELSISLCAVQIHNLRTLGSKNQIAKAVLLAIFSRSLCCKIQWKKRGKDLRFAFGHLINLNAVFGVVINSVLAIHKRPSLPMSTMTEVIQKARRFIGYEYSQSITKSACAAATENQVDDDDAAITKADKETIMAIDQRMVQLNKALIEYDAQHEQPPKKLVCCSFCQLNQSCRQLIAVRILDYILFKTSVLSLIWKGMLTEKEFFTRGAGYIGSPCVVELMELAIWLFLARSLGRLAASGSDSIQLSRVIKEITLTLPRNKSLERIIHYTVAKKLKAKKLNLKNRAKKRPIDNSPSKDSSSSSFRADKEKSKLQKELLSLQSSLCLKLSQPTKKGPVKTYTKQVEKLELHVHEKTLNQGSSIAEIQVRKYQLFEDQLSSSQINSNICVVALKTKNASKYEHACTFLTEEIEEIRRKFHIQISALISKCSGLEKRTSRLQSEVDVLIIDLEKANSTTASNLSSSTLNSNSNQLTRENKKLGDENAELKSQYSELNCRFHELDIEYRRLENEREKLAYKEIQRLVKVKNIAFNSWNCS
ncbi:hypothetical protein OUZ56_030228 [Daphnia magna]|uniref:Uncharacterized protein n=1 Tax=Daphnia magna TaxID=35525 RepID=A0ABQ9ZQN8_9CRUS|nr:hypothetical protein OUZ56_030228 [Daphnia magna]